VLRMGGSGTWRRRQRSYHNVMNPSREAFLQRVRQAVAAGNRAGMPAAIPARGQVGYQGAGADVVAQFCSEFTAAGGTPHTVSNAQDAAVKVLELVRSRAARQVLLGRGPVLDQLELRSPLVGAGATVTAVEDVTPENCRDPFFAADLGISGVDYLIAETGSIVVVARRDEPRSLSLLPPAHIAVADRGQFLPDLFDLFRPAMWGEGPELPSCLTLITGPSKTGDIELRLVTGVHGPGEVHVVLITG
jgi:L-lactate dehydrogenase complex protein LldG